MKSILFIAFLLVANIYYAQNRCKNIDGFLIDSSLNKPVTQASIKLISKKSIYTTLSDSLGRFQLDSLCEESYSLRIEHEGSIMFVKDSVIIDNKTNLTLTITLNFIHFDFSKLNTCHCDVIRYSPPRPSPIPTLSYQEIQQSVHKFQLADLLLGISSNAQQDKTGELSWSGTQPDNYLFLIDDIKCRELHQIPASSMKSVTVMSHFIPAKYGDTNGGIILIETMSYMDLYYERLRRSEF